MNLKKSVFSLLFALFALLASSAQAFGESYVKRELAKEFAFAPGGQLQSPAPFSAKAASSFPLWLERGLDMQFAPRKAEPDVLDSIVFDFSVLGDRVTRDTVVRGFRWRPSRDETIRIKASGVVVWYEPRYQPRSFIQVIDQVFLSPIRALASNGL